VIARRKEIYLELHPETKKGGDRKSEDAKSKRQNDALKSFASDTAAKTGKSKRTPPLLKIGVPFRDPNLLG